MTARPRALAILAMLLALAVVVPTVVAYEAGYNRGRRTYRDLERRLAQVEVEVQVLNEDMAELLE